MSRRAVHVALPPPWMLARLQSQLSRNCSWLRLLLRTPLTCLDGRISRRDADMQAKPQAKLPALFLLDSIVKNAGEPFVAIFARNLPQAGAALFSRKKLPDTNACSSILLCCIISICSEAAKATGVTSQSALGKICV